MSRFLIVAGAAVVMVVFVLVHLYAGALLVGIVFGTMYFFAAIGKGEGLKDIRITSDPGQPRKPGDPNSSIGMGLAASGIASTAMVNASYPSSFRMFFGVCFAVGLLISLGYAGKSAFGYGMPTGRDAGGKTPPDSTI